MRFRNHIILILALVSHWSYGQLITDSDARLMTIKGERSGFQRGPQQSPSRIPFMYSKNKVDHKYSPGHPFEFHKHRIPKRSGSLAIPFAYKDHRVPHRSGSMPIPFAYKDHRVPHRSGSMPIPFAYKDHRVPHRSGSMPIPFAYKDHRVPNRSGSMPIPFDYKKYRTKPRYAALANPFPYKQYRVKPNKSASEHPFKPHPLANKIYIPFNPFVYQSPPSKFIGSYKVGRHKILASKKDQGYIYYKTGLPIGNFTLGNNLGSSSVNGKVAKPKFDRKEKEIWNN